MKKAILIPLILVFGLSLSGCGKPAAVNPADNVNSAASVLVPETGTVIDVTDLNGKTVTSTPGDVIYLKLTGDNDGRHQWNYASAEAIDYLSLKTSKTAGLDGSKPVGQFTSEWWLKVEKIGSFDIIYQYSQPQKKADKTFQVKIISQ